MQTASWWRRPLLLAGGVFLKFTAHEMVLVDSGPSLTGSDCV